MNYTIENLFPTPIYVTILDNFEKINEEIRSKYDEFIFDGSRASWGKSTMVTNLHGNIIKEFNMSILQETLNHNINNYISELGWNITLTIEDYKLRSWMTVNPPNTHTHVHDHSYHELSGVYYYETNQKDGNLFFITPAGGMSGSYFLERPARPLDYMPTVGKLIIFPGYLCHGVKTNETSHTRKALAFSITLKCRR